MNEQDRASYLAVYGRTLGAGGKRRPTKRMKDEITTKQQGCCLYCGLRIGWTVDRRGDEVTLMPQWDHFVPFSYSRANNRQNWVLACHICNNIKGCKLFTTVLEVQEFVNARRAEKGYGGQALPPISQRVKASEGEAAPGPQKAAQEGQR